MLTRAGSALAGLLLLPLALAAGQYPMEGGDLRRSGHAVSPTALVLPLDLQWSTQMCVGEPVTNPIVLDDKVVVSTRLGVFCMRRADGAALWKWSSEGYGWVWNAPAYDPDRGLLYVTTYNGLLVALDLSTGDPQWMRNEGVEKDCGSLASPIYLAGRILYKNAKRDWVCLDADTHAEVWRHSFTAAQFGGTPSLDGGLLYIGGTHGELSCLNWSDGSVVWTRQNGWTHGYTSALVLSDTHIYAMCDIGLLECRLRSDGSLVWSHQTDSYALGSPSYDGTSVYCSSDDRTICALDPLTGALKWRRGHSGNFARSAPFSCGGVVFSSGCTGEFYGDNAGSGSADWSYTHGADNSFDDWASVDGELYVANIGGKVFCFKSHCPGCTVTVSPTYSPSATVTPTPTASPTSTVTGSATPSGTPSASPSASPTATPSATASASCTQTPSASPTATSSATPTASPTRTITVSVTATPTATATPTISATYTAVPPTGTPRPGDAPNGLDDPGDHCYTYPNPSDGGDVHIVYRVDGPCKARIRVFQSAGEPAAMIEERHETAGVKRCTVPAGGFAPGVYFYKVDMRYDDGKHDKRPIGKFICRPR